VGSHTVKELAGRGYKVLVLDNLINGHRDFVAEDIPFIKGDLEDEKLLTTIFQKYPIKGVIHLAAFAYVGESVKKPKKYFQNNIENGLKLLRCMLTNNVKKIVFSSSCTVYGESDKDLLDEASAIAPINPYGLSKQVFEQVLQYYDDAYSMKSVCLRYFNASGAHPDGSIGELHEPETHVIPILIDCLFNGTEFSVYGNDYPTYDGTCIRDYVHVCDIAKAHVYAIEKLLSDNGQSDVYNLGTGKGISVLQLIKLTQELSGMKVNYKYVQRREGDPPKLVACNSKAKRELNWIPDYDTKDIIKHALKWHKKLHKLMPDGKDV
jgi:UDP-glucose 4-epimerase